MDGGGNLYIADFGNSVIRKISGSGTITTVAGNGIAGYYGDGALAAHPRPSPCSRIDQRSDSSGDLFIAYTCNQKIREVTPDGIIVTAAGNGTEGYAGDSSPAPQAELNYPGGVAIASAKILSPIGTTTSSACFRPSSPIHEAERIEPWTAGFSHAALRTRRP